ncbi:major facilitator superfamily domain-containing protein [Xylariaceae sp. FL1272]|nr:major facilitator superfamily domain-containing protein [Xylariaceae sp. FL1272]
MMGEFPDRLPHKALSMTGTEEMADKPVQMDLEQEKLTIDVRPSDDEHVSFNYISGLQLHVFTFGLLLVFFLVNLEVTIVSTALVSITSDLQDFARASWVVTAYLITFTSGLVIWAKLSDLWGRKWTMVSTLVIFIAFSGACGGAQTIVQLIVFRALQGLGGSGAHALSIVLIYEMVPPPKYPLYTALTTSFTALAYALGPIFGGLITESGSWRWAFLLNVPVGAMCVLLIIIIVPHDFPYQGLHVEKKRFGLPAVDFVGALLMTAALALLITGLEEAASLLTWNTATVIGPLVASVPVWAAFVTSQWWSTKPSSRKEPVFPWRFCLDRVTMGLLLYLIVWSRNAFTTGAVSVTCIIQLPIRYQTSVGTSPLQAGVRLIPFSAFGPLGAMIAAIVIQKFKVPPIYLALVGSGFQIIGLVLFSLGPPGMPDWHALYGIQVITAMGQGFAICTVTLLTPFVVEKRDLAVGSAAGTQFRFLGSAVAVSVTTGVGNGLVRDKLLGQLSPTQLKGIFRSAGMINALPESVIPVVRSTFVEAFNLEMRIVLGFAVASVFTILLVWKRPQIKVI